MLTGDFFTIEAYVAAKNTLADALAPLAAYHYNFGYLN